MLTQKGKSYAFTLLSRIVLSFALSHDRAWRDTGCLGFLKNIKLIHYVDNTTVLPNSHST